MDINLIKITVIYFGFILSNVVAYNIGKLKAHIEFIKRLDEVIEHAKKLADEHRALEKKKPKQINNLENK